MATILAEPKTTAEDLLQVSFPILKWEEDADGDLIVKGIATDGTVDADEQIVDPVWSAKALNTWSATGANVRQSHDPRHPVGKGLSVEIDRNGSGKHWVTSVIVDPLAQKLVKKGVLTAYSIGIARPVIKHDPTGRARGGVIVGGELAELSIVDRPSNKSSYLEIAKSAANGDIEFTGKMHADDDVIAKFAGAEVMKADNRFSSSQVFPDVPEDMSLTFTPADLAKILKSKIIDQHYDELALKALYDAEEAVYKRNVNTAERRSLASEGNALSDGSYPIANAGDLHNAAHLARTGHGNAEAAKKLVARRAKELGVANPLADSDSDDSGKGAYVESTLETPEVIKEDAVIEDAVKEATPEIIKDPEDTEASDEPGNKASKPKKTPKGKKMPPWLNKPDSDGDDDSKGDSPDCKEMHAHTEKCSGTPKSASGATDAADMQEIPNTGPATETPAPAGIRTADLKALGSSPETAAMLRFKTIGVDTDLGRLHDLTCSAFHPEDVAKYHPYADLSNVIDLDVWQRKAVDAACGPLAEAMELTKAWSAAQTLKSADLADLNDFRVEAHKAFRDANPGVSSYPSPGTISPGSYNRGVITAGHAANSPGYDSPNSSPDVASSTPNATHFDRPPLSAGHQSPSPSHMKGDGQYPAEQGVPTRIDYAHVEKEKARQALSLMHDNISRMFPPLCPISQNVMQPESRPVPPAAGLGKAVTPAEEVAAVSKSPEMPQEVLDSIEKGMKKKLGKKVLAGKMTVDEARSKIGRMRAQKMEQWTQEELVKTQFNNGIISRDEALKALGFEVQEAPVTKSAVPEIVKAVNVPVQVNVDPDMIKSAIADAIAPLMETITIQKSRIDDQQQKLEALADIPDPSTSSWAGLALKSARPAGVAKQAEIAERTQQMINRQLNHVWRTSENPHEREAARNELDKRGFAE